MLLAYNTSRSMQVCKLAPTGVHTAASWRRAPSSVRVARHQAGVRTGVTASAEMSAPIKIVGISGSLRKASTNTGLLHAALKHLPPGVTMQIADLSEVPMFNEDLYQGKSDDSLVPESVKKLRALVADADALLLAVPEYNFSISGPLKNALDWVSRPNVASGKAAAMVGAGGGAGTSRAQHHVRQVGVFLNLHFINSDVQIPRFANPAMFSAEGELQDPTVEARVAKQVEALTAWARKIKD